MRTIAEGVKEIENELACRASVGVGIPGTMSGITGLAKNANSTWMNGKPFDKDLGRAPGLIAIFAAKPRHKPRRLVDLRPWRDRSNM